MKLPIAATLGTLLYILSLVECAPAPVARPDVSLSLGDAPPASPASPPALSLDGTPPAPPSTPPTVIQSTSNTSSTTTTVGYDTTYDNPNLSTTSIACSDGKNGLSTKGYKTLGSIPKFPNVAAAFTIEGWNSPQCGKCYRLKYEGRTVYVTAVDVAKEGFVISMGVMDALTGGRAVEAGRVSVEWKQVGIYNCGFAK
ncbi:hypothetical protein HDV00_010525 [Rhizophlyctis rosea]|nr:hypothetical protein HDV00_010525 [Rhizophlyctis rosea]